MNKEQLRALLNSLGTKLREQVVKDPYGGEAFVARLTKIIEQKKLKTFEDGDFEALRQLDSKDLILDYLKSLIEPASLGQDDVLLLNKLESELGATANSRDLLTRLSYTVQLAWEKASGEASPAGMVEEMDVQFKLSGDTVDVELTHPLVKKDLGGDKLQNLMESDYEPKEEGYTGEEKSAEIGEPETPSATEALEVYLTPEQIKSSVDFMAKASSKINALVSTEEGSKRTPADVLKLAKEPNKVNELLDKVSAIGQTIRELRIRCAALGDTYKEDLTLMNSAVLSVNPSDDMYKSLKAQEKPTYTAEVISEINSINEKTKETLTVADELLDGVDLSDALSALSHLKYIQTGKYGVQNDIIASDTINEFFRNVALEKNYERQYQLLKSQQAKQSNNQDPSSSDSKSEPSKPTSTSSEAVKEKTKTPLELLEFTDSYVEAFKAYRAEIEKSNEYIDFLREAKSIDGLFGKVKTLFDSKRAISKPLYGVLTALAVASTAFVVPVAYSASLVVLALSALTYSAGKLLTIRDIASRQKIKMSEVSSAAITVSSKWEIGAAIATNAAAALLGPLGLAARYSVYLAESVRTAVSVLVTSSVITKEYFVNTNTPLLMSELDFQGAVTQEKVMKDLEDSKNLSSYNEQITEVVKSVKVDDFKDFKVDDKVENKDVTEVLTTSAKLAARLSQLEKSEDKISEIKPLYEDLSRLVKSSQFKHSIASSDLKKQPKGTQLLRQISDASRGIANALRLVSGGMKAEEFKKDTYSSQDFGLGAIIPTR